MAEPNGQYRFVPVTAVLAAAGCLLQVIVLWWASDITSRMRSEELEQRTLVTIMQGQQKTLEAMQHSIEAQQMLLPMLKTFGEHEANIRHLLTLYYDHDATLRGMRQPARSAAEEYPLSQRQGR